MKYIDEYRRPEAARRLLDEIAGATEKDWVIMEVCGGQTHTIIRNGIDRMLPRRIELVHGPGCPVCVTPAEKIDRALKIAERPDVIFCTFGDMMRVPGSHTDLFEVKSRGGDVRMVYSPLDSIEIARNNPGKKVVFFGIGFETTIPLTAALVKQASALGLTNFSLLASHVLVPPAVCALMQSPGNRLQGLLAAGHVCTVMGLGEYETLAREFSLPIVATGFEPLDILQGVLMLVRQLESGRAEVENQYSRVVRPEGNPTAIRAINEVFEIVDLKWRGIGEIPQSGMAIRPEYAAFDAEKLFDLGHIITEEPTECIAGEILTGQKKPVDCPAFGVRCDRQKPLGAPMASAEGACAAYALDSRKKY